MIFACFSHEIMKNEQNDSFELKVTATIVCVEFRLFSISLRRNKLLWLVENETDEIDICRVANSQKKCSVCNGKWNNRVKAIQRKRKTKSNIFSIERLESEFPKTQITNCRSRHPREKFLRRHKLVIEINVWVNEMLLRHCKSLTRRFFLSFVYCFFVHLFVNWLLANKTNEKNGRVRKNDLKLTFETR